VREQYHHGGSLAARLVDHALQALLLDSESPVGDEAARMGDGRVGERLATIATGTPPRLRRE